MKETLTSSSISLDKVNEYFSRLNPIASRICMDMKDMKDTYGELWCTFSANEQNDIINETLINPEISLKYFDKFLSLSLVDSSPSVPKDLANEDQDPVCGFDGRNLKTYGSQKVALKSIQDDVFGKCRDEHSSPFSYRTKSQINLFTTDIKNKDESKTALNEGDNLGKLSGMFSLKHSNLEMTKSLVDYKIINELKKTIENKNTRKNSNLHSGERKFAVVGTDKSWDAKNNVTAKTSFPVQVKPTRNHQFYLTCDYTNSTAVPSPTTNAGPTKNHAVYTDVYCDYEENSTLMQNTSGGGNNLASSANTSDDDHYDYESEDVKLLDNEISLKKGFDFLNNW